MEKLKPCPACGGYDVEEISGCIRCNNSCCELLGPENDKYGSKWNALPRREDKPKEDGFRKHWRYEFAGMAMHGLLSAIYTSKEMLDEFTTDHTSLLKKHITGCEAVTRNAISYADALLKKLDD